jgi:hypothetical protein
MRANLFIALLMPLAASLFSISCSGNSPVLPDASDSRPETNNGSITGTLSNCENSEGNRYLWGYYNISWNPETGEAEVIPVREIEGHYNVLRFLEHGPCNNCVRVLSATPTADGTTIFDVRITHPFTQMNFTGFDVRGVAIFDGSHTFSGSGNMAPDRNMGDGELIDATGYTALYNSTTVGAGPGGLEGYQEGNFASSTIPNATLNGFHYFVSNSPGNTRNMFNAGDAITVSYEIDMPDSGLVFGYAVDASWVPPTTKPVTDPLTDFPPEANCSEPWKIETNEAGTGLTTKGGNAQLWVHVYDYNGPTSFNPPTIECPDLFLGTIVMTLNSTASDHSLWYVDLPNDLLPPAGTYKALISVEDIDNGSMPPHMDLTAYQICDIEVVEDTGWARTWGSTGIDGCQQPAIDMDGYVITTGSFEGAPGEQIDFDPGPGEDLHTCAGGTDAFVSKFSPNGEHEWTLTFGGTGNDAGIDVDVMGTDIIRVCGYFSDSFDFDPTGGIQIRTSMGGTDAFLIQLDTAGGVTWVDAWGGTQDDGANSICTNGTLATGYCAGYFRQIVDFDPGAGTFAATSNGGMDCFVSRIDNSGNLIKTLTWGGPTDDCANAVQARYAGDYFITGFFSGTADFDPGPGTDPRTCAGILDGFLLRMDNADTAVFTRTWGGLLFDEGRDLILDDSGNAYVAGYFTGTADFNPYGASDYKTSHGLTDAFLAKFSYSGNYEWCAYWGGPGADVAFTVARGSAGEIFTGGYFEGTVDFDPGTGGDNHNDPGSGGGFLLSLNPDSSFNWANTITGSNIDSVYGVAAMADEHVYIGGMFGDTINFDPGTGTDDHTPSGATDAFLVKYFQDGSW